MIEAGLAIVALAILWTGWVYKKQQEVNRAEFSARMDYLYAAIGRNGVVTSDAIEKAGRSTDRLLRENVEALAPLCESLAESLSKQMDTINSDMADLRTRVETGPGKRTLRV